jgi:signal transduction histidine kinase
MTVRPSSADLARRQHAALRRVAGLIGGGAPAAAIFGAVAREVADVTGSGLVQIQRFEADDTVTVMGAWGVDPHPFQPGTRWGLKGSQIAATIKRTGMPVRIDDFGHGEGPIQAGVRKTGIRGGAGAPIVVDGTLWGAVAAGPRVGEPVPDDLEDRLAAFTELVGTAISNADGREALARLAEQHAALRRVATLVAKGVGAPELFEAITREAGQLLGAAAMHMGRFDADAAICVAGWSPNGEHLPPGTRVELDGGNVASRVHRTGRPARVDGVAGEPESEAERLRRGMGVSSSVAVPVAVQGRLWGLMIASSRRESPLPGDAEARLLGFTELAETAIANSEARSQLAASRARLVAAADAERRRVVSELRDGAQQRLELAIAALERARDELGTDDDAGTRELVRESLVQARRTKAELRELTHGILPDVLLQGGLRAAAEALASRMGVPVALDVAAGRHPAPVEATAYFVIAEALTNVAKHSGAEHATVEVAVDADVLRVRVRDDGAGGASAYGSGLVGLRDRLAAHDGSLDVDSRGGAGTTVTARIPLRETA